MNTDLDTIDAIFSATGTSVAMNIDGANIDSSPIGANTASTGAFTTLSTTGVLTQDGGAVFNEASADVDFRVESNGNTHMLFVDGGTNSVGIGGTPTNAGISGAASPVLAIIGTVPELNFVDTSGSANDYWMRVSDGLQFGEASDSRMYLKNGGNLGINTTSPDTMLHVHKATAGSVTANSNTQLTIENNDHAGLGFLSPNDANSIIYFGDVDDNDVGYINYAHASNSMNFQTNASLAMTIRSTGALEVGAGFTSGQGGDDGNNVGIKMSEYDLTINSENVTSGYVDVETNINRSNYLGCIPTIYDSSANVAKMGYRSDAGFVTYADGYTNIVRVGLGGDVAASDIIKLVVMYV